MVIAVGHQYKNKISIFKGPGIFFKVIIIVLSLTSLGCLWSGESWSLLIVMLSRSQIYLLWSVLLKNLSLHWSWNETRESRKEKNCESSPYEPFTVQDLEVLPQVLKKCSNSICKVLASWMKSTRYVEPQRTSILLIGNTSVLLFWEVWKMLKTKWSVNLLQEG